MSFLTRTTPIARSFAARSALPTARSFSAGFVHRRSPVETAKDAAKTVDRAVSDKLVDGIELGQNAAQKAKDVAGMSSSEAAAKKDELVGKASELSGQATGKASELSGQATGKASELSGQAKGKASEVAGMAKGKKEEVKGKL